MTGRHHVVVETARLKYEFDIRRNITVIKGDSATGKTTLIGLLQAFSLRGERSGVEVTSDVPCSVYSGDMQSWRTILSGYPTGIIFIDEDYSFITSKDFADYIRGTKHYYVLITRRDLTCLPYSVNEIYGIRTSGRYHFPQKIYNEFYHIYKDDYPAMIDAPVLITEDSGAGFQFFSRIAEDITCISAAGNSNILNILSKLDTSHEPVIIADGAAFGSFISKVLAALSLRKDAMLFLPESFEWLILRSGIIQSKNLNDILDRPEDYIESSQFFSWEQFFTDRLIKLTAENDVQRYDKSKLSQYYTGAVSARKILETMPHELTDILKSSSLH